MIQKKNKSNSKQNKQQLKQLIVNVKISNDKHINIKIPHPCPTTTMKQCLNQSLSHILNKIAYFQTINSDWLTDYKIQVGEGWIRNNINLKCIFKQNQFQKYSGIQSYQMLKCIGVGGFSKVYLCRDKRTGQFNAAKFIQKQRLNGKTDLIINQRIVNQQISFPFLVSMKDFYQTQIYYIMILDYCPGGQLFHLQKNIIRFNQNQAKKYFIEVLLAIQYLHSKNIVYRDLKPENIMIDLKGHIQIADFGLARITKEKRYSYCGSLQYMSPEIVGRIGHSFEVDYYCLGALLYQMTVGCPPFYCYSSSQNETKTRILYEQVQFPNQIELSDGIKDLIRQLLIKDPTKRLGHLGGIKQIKCHSWIGWINKSDYLQKKIKMSYPVNLDTFNFDSTDITISANRILKNIQQQKIKNKQNTITLSKDKKYKKYKINKLYSKQKDKYKQYYINYSLNKSKSKSSNHKQKIYYKLSPNKNISLYKFKNQNYHSYSNLKLNKFQTIKNCYLNNTNNLSKFLRFPTETYQHTHNTQNNKERRSYIKLDTENNKNIKKRKAKDQYTFQKIKRNI